MNYDIVTFGIPMVELMRKELDVPLHEAGEFVGPFAAGDPGITLNACVTLGYTGCYVGVVGGDPLAECFMARMRKSGIDTSRLRVDAERSTGLSVLAKFSDGSRSFVFSLRHSAAAQLGPADLDDELIRRVKWIHVSGFALAISDSIVELHRALMRKIGREVRVSFDPNYRRDIIDADRHKDICAEVFERCDLFLPSYGEAGAFCPDARDELDACRRIAARGKLVALKNGARGSHAFKERGETYFPAVATREVDPTGAGDSFGGAVIAGLLDGMDFFDAVRYGNAAGGVAVSRVGLMDIAPTREDIQEALRSETR